MSDLSLPSSFKAVRGRLQSQFPVLIADHDAPIFVHELRKDFPDLGFDLCASLDQAKERLLTKRYQTCVVNVRFAEDHDFSLLKQNLSDQPYTPCLITVAAADKTRAYQAIREGAFDSFLKPLKILQAVPTLQRALWLFQFRETVAEKKVSLAMFKAHRNSLSINGSRKAIINRSAVHVEDVLASCERTIAAIEQSLQKLQYQEADYTRTARARAMKRLDGL